MRVSPKNERKFRNRVKQITRRNRGVSMSLRFTELHRYFQGWVAYFRFVPIKTYFAELDKWIRRRIRACDWKHWRGVRTRIANLRRLGVKDDEAVTHGCSRKGPVDAVVTLKAMHEALSLDYLAQEGLVSLFTIWQTLTAKDLNRRCGPMPGGVGSAPRLTYADPG
ncbi:MAG: group II intron maturase-specific domain-containing protein [Planctomycetaceae bacterium]